MQSPGYLCEYICALKFIRGLCWCIARQGSVLLYVKCTAQTIVIVAAARTVVAAVSRVIAVAVAVATTTTYAPVVAGP